MEGIIIRNVKEEDIPLVVDIQINGWKTAYRGIIDDISLDTMNKEAKIEKRKKDYKDSGFIVAEVEGEIVGFCRYIDSNKFSPEETNIDCELLALYVKPELKYNGIGTKLFEHVVKEFKSKNKKQMILWCLKDNENSKKFYTKMGGKIHKEKLIEIDNKNYYEVSFIYDLSK